jgi:hypothetical protein
MNIRDAAKAIDMSEMYVRTLLRNGKLKAIKNGAGNWEITDEDIATFKATRTEQRSTTHKIKTPKQGKMLGDGGPAPEGAPLVVHIPPEMLSEVAEFLHSRGIIMQKKAQYSRAAARDWQAAYAASMVETGTFNWREWSAYYAEDLKVKAAAVKLGLVNGVMTPATVTSSAIIVDNWQSELADGDEETEDLEPQDFLETED